MTEIGRIHLTEQAFIVMPGQDYTPPGMPEAESLCGSTEVNSFVVPMNSYLDGEFTLLGVPLAVCEDCLAHPDVAMYQLAHVGESA